MSRAHGRAGAAAETWMDYAQSLRPREQTKKVSQVVASYFATCVTGLPESFANRTDSDLYPSLHWRRNRHSAPPDLVVVRLTKMSTKSVMVTL
jgi:hypothetical protein